MSEAVRKAGNLTYKAQVMPHGIAERPFDGYVLKMIRYQRDTAEADYWMLDGAVPRWIEATHHIEVASLHWPKIAYAIASNVQEPEAREALEAAIREMEQMEAKSRKR